MQASKSLVEDMTLRRFREKVLTGLKLLIALALVSWLIATGKLNFNDLGVYWLAPQILSVSLVCWLCGSLCCCTLRWQSLVAGLGIPLPKVQALRLNLIGLFFSTIMPGAVGGDVIKAMYLWRRQAGQSKTLALLTVFLDRVMGLTALLILSLLGIVLNWPVVVAHPILRPVVYAILAFLATAAVFIALAWWPKTQQKFALWRWFSDKVQGFRLVEQLAAALHAYKDNPASLVRALGYGLGHQSLFIALYVVVTLTVSARPVSLGHLLIILPIGIITTAIPLAPGGLGVGHLAFEKLFQLIGLTGGANVFNIIFLGQLILNLLGAIPYVFNRSEVSALIEEHSL